MYSFCAEDPESLTFMQTNASPSLAFEDAWKPRESCKAGHFELAGFRKVRVGERRLRLGGCFGPGEALRARLGDIKVRTMTSTEAMVTTPQKWIS